MKTNITTLRDCVEWANWQHEDWWLPAERPEPTALDILDIYTLVMEMGVETIECALDMPEDSTLEGLRNIMRKRRLRRLLGK